MKSLVRDLFVTLGLSAVILTCPCLLLNLLCWLDLESRRHANFDRLLAGSEAVGIKRLVILAPYDKQARFEFEDPDTLRYLSRAVRTAMHTRDAPPNVPIYGATYNAVIELEPAGTVAVFLHIPQVEIGLTLSYCASDFGDPDHYWVFFGPPMPARLAETLKRLR